MYDHHKLGVQYRYMAYKANNTVEKLFQYSNLPCTFYVDTLNGILLWYQKWYGPSIEIWDDRNWELRNCSSWWSLLSWFSSKVENIANALVPKQVCKIICHRCCNSTFAWKENTRHLFKIHKVFERQEVPPLVHNSSLIWRKATSDVHMLGMAIVSTALSLHQK